MLGMILGAVGAIGKIAKGPIGKAIGSKVGGFVGGLFGKKRKKKGVENPSPVGELRAAQMSVDVGENGGPGFGGDLPEKINDWLGRSTKDARTIETSVKPQTMLYMGLGALALVVVGAFAFKR